MTGKLRRDDTIRASTVVRAAPAEVFRVVSDPTRYPEWSPECHRVEWVDDTHFVGHNRRRRGRWKTTATVVANEPDREFRFVVEMMGKDFTGWAYLVEPHAEGALLTEEFVMRVDLPLVARLFEVLALGVRDRRTDLQGNLDRCVRTVRGIVEREVGERAPADGR